jgi:hypothetical protein
MKSRGIARVGLLASGLVISSLMVSTPDIARSDALGTSSSVSGPISGSNGGSAVAGGRGDYVQHLGCDKFAKPSCNKPGRRSSHR